MSRPNAIQRTMARLAGMGAFDAGKRPLDGCRFTSGPAALRHAWTQGYADAAVSAILNNIGKLDVFPVKPARDGRRWAGLEHDVLAALVARGISLVIASRILGRRYEATRQYASGQRLTRMERVA